MSTIIVGVVFDWGRTTPVDGAIVTPSSEALFRVDGTHNQTLARELYALSLITERNLSADGSHYAASSMDILASNYLLPRIRLFEQVGTIGGLPGTVNINQMVGNFTRVNWRLNYISWPLGGRWPVFTFLATEAYASTQFSAARNHMTATFDAVLGHFPGATTSIVTPRMLPGNWQKTQYDLQFRLNNSIPEHWLDDKIWMPSAFELRPEMWGGATMPSSGAVLGEVFGFRRFNGAQGSTSLHFSWLRSTSGDALGPQRRINGLIWSGVVGNLQGRYHDASHYILPAIHICLSDLVGDGFPAIFHMGDHPLMLDRFDMHWVYPGQVLAPPPPIERTGYVAYWAIRGTQVPLLDWNTITSPTVFVPYWRRNPTWFDVI